VRGIILSMKKSLAWGAAALGVVFVIIAIVYLMTPAKSLPSFMPGFEAGSLTIHYKHAIGSLILGFALFAFAWFKGAPEKAA